jgi:hypothetical protein
MRDRCLPERAHALDESTGRGARGKCRAPGCAQSPEISEILTDLRQELDNRGLRVTRVTRRRLDQCMAWLMC